MRPSVDLKPMATKEWASSPRKRGARRSLLVLVFLMAAASLVAQTRSTPAQGGAGSGGSASGGSADTLIVSRVDLNGDGKPDLVTYTDAKGTVVRDEQDFNHDGTMDDFRYYQSGQLVREEIDSDFDGRIDLWVYLVGGDSIQRYERDTNGDGKPDTVRVFGGS